MQVFFKLSNFNIIFGRKTSLGMCPHHIQKTLHLLCGPDNHTLIRHDFPVRDRNVLDGIY